MQLAFRGTAAPDDVRAFLAALVSEGGTWQQTAHTPLPAEGHDDARLARTEWVLGEARLTQVISGGAGNPRDGYGFDLAITAALPGGRRVEITGGGYEPTFTSLLFSLRGFSVSQFVRARELARARFTDDDTGHPIWARDNARAVEALGDKAFARTLVLEALGRKAPAFARAAQRELRRHLIRLTDDGAEKTALEADALEQDPTDVATLAAIAAGTRTLPRWSPARAARILEAMRPWDSPRWAALDPKVWCWVNVQPYDVKVIDGKRAQVPRGPPLPAVFRAVVEAVQRALGLEGFAAPSDRDEDREGVLLPGETVRGFAYRRDAALEWVWVWTGEGERGAIVVATRSAPVEIRLCWLGAPPAAFDRFVLTPC